MVSKLVWDHEADFKLIQARRTGPAIVVLNYTQGWASIATVLDT